MTPSRPVPRYRRIGWSIVALLLALIGALHGLHADSGAGTTLSAPPIMLLPSPVVPAPTAPAPAAEETTDGEPALHCTADHHPHEGVAGSTARLPVRTVTLADGDGFTAVPAVRTRRLPVRAVRPDIDRRGPGPSLIRLCVQRI